MEITWYGHSCFRLTERGMASVVTDPYDSKVIGYAPLKLRAHIVTVSNDDPGHNNTSVVKSKPRIIKGPGEYEIGDVFITAVRTNGNSRRRKKEPYNTLYVFDYNGTTVAHLGDLRRMPHQTQIEALGNLNVALVPVGGGGGLTAAKAAEVVSLVEPGVVIPMCYQTPDSKLKLDSVDKFLKEMGISDVEPLDSLKVSRTTVPDETRVVVLKYKRA
ncbi:MAG: MBL fold metallo-hydrolase [Anaerolineales bacterium]